MKGGWSKLDKIETANLKNDGPTFFKSSCIKQVVNNNLCLLCKRDSIFDSFTCLSLELVKITQGRIAKKIA